MSRESNGIHVSLCWNRGTGEVLVAVFDASSHAAFDLEVGSANPIDVFNHPYAYAAFGRVNYEQPGDCDDLEPLAA